MVACQFGHEGCLAALLAAGVDPNAPTESGNPLLNLAMDAKSFNVVHVLVEHGANVNAKSTVGRTSLMTAAMYDNLETARLLLTKGADPSARRTDGRDAVAHAKSSAMRELLTEAIQKRKDVAPQVKTEE